MSRIVIVVYSVPNEAGRQGRGAALEAARHHGAIYGQGFGPQGSSFCDPDEGSGAHY
jgi:hypothetical protein